MEKTVENLKILLDMLEEQAQNILDAVAIERAALENSALSPNGDRTSVRVDVAAYYAAVDAAAIEPAKNLPSRT